MLVASPDGENESIQLRQQIWITQLNITPESAQHIKLKGKNAYLQSIRGGATLQAENGETIEMSCNDGVFIQNENALTLSSSKSMRALLIDLGA
ncbi:Pirin-like protein YhaK [Providencia stuartii]|nr:Pirin-like protein YhaK [Providencia stuartii]